MNKNELTKKMFSFGHCPIYLYPPPPNSGSLINVKTNVLAHITEPSNDDYNNDDDCDFNFGSFDDFGVKNDKNVYT